MPRLNLKNEIKMKKLVLYMAMLLVGISYAFAQGKADIKFDKTSYDFGTFSENSPVVKIGRAHV